MKTKGYIFLGTSIRGRNEAEGRKIADHICKIAAVLTENGYRCDSTILTNTAIYSGSGMQPEIPKTYFKMSDALLESVKALRPHHDPERIRLDIAVHRWTIDLIKKSVGCIWEGSRSYAGMGFEVAAALNLERHCLVLYDRPEANQTISSLISGSTSRLLTVKRFKADYRKVIEKFCAKIESALDKIVRFNISEEMSKRIDQRVNVYGFKDRSEYLRYLVSKDSEQEFRKKDG